MTDNANKTTTNKKCKAYIREQYGGVCASITNGGWGFEKLMAITYNLLLYDLLCHSEFTRYNGYDALYGSLSIGLKK